MRTSSSARAAAFAALASLAACATAPALAPPSTELRAQVLIYSGRPNPALTIEDEARIGELRALLAELPRNPEFRGETVVPSILGYAGIVVMNGDPTRGLPATVAVHRGDVEMRDGKCSFFRDPDGKLEAWLLARFTERELLGERELAMIRGG